MLVLAVDTSTPACSVALVEIGPASSTGPRPGDPGLAGLVPEPGPAGLVADPSGGPAVAAAPAPALAPVHLLAHRRVVDARRHGELLAPLVEAVLAEAATRPADLAALVVGLGPGPFTSLRVGIVTAHTFAAALGVPCHGVCSLDGIGAATTGQAGVVTDARRREVFWAGYADGRRIAGPAVNYPARAAELLLAAGMDTLAGPGQALYPDAFTAFSAAVAGSGLPLAGPSGPEYPNPAVLAGLAAADVGGGRVPAPLTPIYLRRPDVAEPHQAKPVTV